MNYTSGLSRDKAIDSFVNEYLTVVSETTTEYACYCPFHSNTSSPAFYINKRTGLWHCFNPACDKKGSFTFLVKKMTGSDIAWRYRPHYSDDSLLDMLESDGGGLVSVPENWDEAMDRIFIDYSDKNEARSKLNYLIDRGYTLETLEYFEVGYSERQGRIVIPSRDIFFNIVGFIGRATKPDQYPKYLYSDNFPRRETLFNLQNAKAFREVILTEGSLDAMRVHQAGFPNVVATLGAAIPSGHNNILNKFFDSLVLFFDNDEAGDAAKRAIMKGNPRKDLWIVPYPSGVKDPGEMTEEQIKTSINQKIHYLDWLFQTQGEE